VTKINVITPPDILYNDTFTIVMVCPGDWIRRQLQKVLETFPVDCNVYLLEDNAVDIPWTLALLKTADVFIYDIDNSTDSIRHFTSYFISHDNVFWLTNTEYPYYNMLSVNRVYDLNFLNDTIGGYLEKKQKRNS
jgi:hypothetical protein